MLQEAREFIEKNQMLQYGDAVVVGVSGGADSMCLLDILWKLRPEYKLILKVVHIHHGIRGKDADEDSVYVHRVCEQLEIPCEVFYCNVEKEAQNRRISVEEAGRIIRYDIFNKTIMEMGGGKIAVAHHMNDQAETVLMRLFRGTGSKGLGGMKAVRDNVVRPLLCFNRERIEAYCREHHILYQHDYTNELAIYTRNRIRLDLIPYIKEYFNPNIVEALCQTSNLLQEQEEYMELEAESVYNRVVESEDDSIIQVHIERLNMVHSSIQKRIIRKVLSKVLKELNEIGYRHIEDILDLMNKESGKQVHLPKEIIVQRQYDYLQFSKATGNSYKFSYKMSIPDQQYIKEINKTVVIQLMDSGSEEKRIITSEKNYTKSFDYDKIKYNLEFRTRKPGDFIKLKGMQGTKKLKDFFIDLKVPREQRDQIPLLTDGSQVIWIVGFRINDEYTITSRTTRVMEVIIDQMNTKNDTTIN